MHIGLCRSAAAALVAARDDLAQGGGGRWRCEAHHTRAAGSALFVNAPTGSFKDAIHDDAAVGLLVVQACNLRKVPRELSQAAADSSLIGLTGSRGRSQAGVSPIKAAERSRRRMIGAL